MVLAEFIGTNATGWSQLFDGNMILAAYTMYDTAFNGWIVVLLFFLYEFMLFMKTRNLTLCFTMGAIFSTLYVTSTFVKPITKYVMVLLLVFEVAGILYMLIFKK